MSVDEVRALISPKLIQGTLYDTDFCLLRWLQGYDCGVEEVAAKLERHLKIREAWDLDRILSSEEANSPVTHYFSGHLFPGPSVHGNEVIYYEKAGKVDGPAFIKAFSILDITRSRTYVYELMFQAMLRLETKCGEQCKVIYILDLEGMQKSAEMLRITMGPLKCLTIYLQENYVEMFSHIVLINSGNFLFYFWKLLQPLLPSKTAEKIVILGNDWAKSILDYVPSASLPQELGGTLDFPLRDLEPIPPALFWPPNRPKFTADFESVSIGVGRVFLKTLPITVPESRIFWKFATNYECRLGAFFTEDEAEEDLDKMTIVFPVFSRFPGPLLIPGEAVIVCRKAGFYKFWFRNDFSWLCSMKVEQELRVEPPPEK